METVATLLREGSVRRARGCGVERIDSPGTCRRFELLLENICLSLYSLKKLKFLDPQDILWKFQKYISHLVDVLLTFLWSNSIMIFFTFLNFDHFDTKFQVRRPFMTFSLYEVTFIWIFFS